MRVTLLTLAVMLGMEADFQVLLWAMALLPAAAAMMFIGFMFRPAARKLPQRDDRRWRGVHREREEPGRHAPARGKRLQGLSRQAQLEERTVYVTPAALLEDQERLRAGGLLSPYARLQEDIRVAVDDRRRLLDSRERNAAPPLRPADPFRLEDPLRETTEAWLAPEAHAHEPYRDGVRIRCRTCKLDIPQPEDMPEVGRGGTWSWDGGTRLGPRPARPRMAPKTPPPRA